MSAMVKLARKLTSRRNLAGTRRHGVVRHVKEPLVLVEPLMREVTRVHPSQVVFDAVMPLWSECTWPLHSLVFAVLVCSAVTLTSARTGLCAQAPGK